MGGDEGTWMSSSMSCRNLIWRKIEGLNLFLIGGLEPGRTLLLSAFDHHGNGMYTQKPSDDSKRESCTGSQQRKYRRPWNVSVLHLKPFTEASVEF